MKKYDNSGSIIFIIRQNLTLFQMNDVPISIECVFAL